MTPRDGLRRATAFGAAKVNIGWRVGERRGDGYHEVCGLLHTISLADHLTFEVGHAEPPGDGGAVFDIGTSSVRLVVSHADLAVESNLVVHAARRMAEVADARPATIEVRKRVPVAAGLGGGSADAAATLVALNQLWGARLPPDRLVELGAEVSSDVPGILCGGLVAVSGRGERVRRVGAATAGAFVCGVGAERISTADAYAAFDEVGPAEPETLHHNDLERAACALVPSLAERLEAMRAAAGNAFVSGSGPTVVAAVADRSLAEEAAREVRGVFADVLVAEPTDWGARLVLGDGA